MKKKYVFIFGSWTATLFAASATWTKGGGANNWNNNANWSANFPNGIDQVATFPGDPSFTITLGQPITVGTINMTGTSTYSIVGADSLTFDVTAGNAQISFSGVAPTLNISTPIILSDTLSITSVPTTNLSGVISGGGGIINAGGFVALSNTNSYTGSTVVNGGILQYEAAGAIPAGSPVTVGDGVTSSQLMYGATISSSNAFNATINSMGSIAPEINLLMVDVFLKSITGSGSLAFPSTQNLFSIGGGPSTTYSGTIGGGVSTIGNPDSLSRFVKTGTSTLTLSGDSSGLVCPTFIAEGIITMQHGNALGLSNTYVRAIGTVGSLYINGSLGLGQSNLFLNGGGVSGFGALRLISGTSTFTGGMQIGWSIGSESMATPVTIATDTGTQITFSGVVSGSSNLTYVGSGTKIYSGASPNTMSGLTTINAGTLQLNKNFSVAALAGNATINSTGTLQLLNASQISDSATITIAGGTFNMGTFPETIGSLIYNTGTLTQGVGATLSLSSAATTALTMQDVTISGPLVFTNATGGITYLVNTGAGATISGNVSLAVGTHTFDIANGAATVDFNMSGIISGASGAITKGNSGILQFSGTSANTYSGLTTVSLGTLRLNKTAGLDAIPGNLTITGGTVQHQAANQIADTATVTLQGGTLDLNGNAETISSLVANTGTYTSGGATLSLTSSATTALSLQDVSLSGNFSFTNATGGVTYTVNTGAGATISGNMAFAAGTHTFNIADGAAAVDLNVSGVISGAGGAITKSTSSGTLQFSGTSANTYSGLTTVSLGTLRLNKTAGLDAIPGNLTISGGTVQHQAANQIADTATVTLQGGTLDLNGNAETISSLVANTGTYTSGGATLSLTSSATTALSLQDVSLSGNFSFTNATGGVTYTVNTGAGATISGNMAFAAGTHTFNIADGAAAVDLNVSGVISGASGAITKSTSSGTLQFSGTSANTYTGLTTVSLGTLQLNKTAGLDAIPGNLTITGGTVQHQAANQIADTATVTLQGGTLDLNANAETISSLVANTGTYTSGGATLSLTSSATTALSLQDLSLSGNFNFTNATGGVTYTVNTGAGSTISGNMDFVAGTHTFNIADGAAAVDLNASGVISGAGAITKSTSSGTLQFSGTSANTYSGLTTVSLGTLRLNKTAGLDAIPGNLTITGGTVQHQAANQIADTATVTLQGGTLDLNANVETISSLVVNTGTYTSGGATLSLTSSATTALSLQDVSLAGNFSFTNATGGITYTVNTGAGATISGNIALAAGTHPFDVANGAATVDLTMSGIISGASSGITKENSGVLEFSGASANTYTGNTTVNAGTLRLNKTAGVDAIPTSVTISGGTVQLQAANQISNSGKVTLQGGTFDLNGNAETIENMIANTGTYISGGATLSLQSSTSSALILQDVSLSGNFSFTNATGGVTYTVNTGAGATISGNMAFAAGTHTFDIANGAAAVDLNISGVISGAGGAITKSTSSGTLQFSGTSANTYTGLTTVNLGQLRLNKTAGVDAIPGNLTIGGGSVQLQASNQIADGSTVTVQGGTFDLNGNSETVTRLVANSGTYTSGGGLLSLTSSATNALTLRDVSLTGNFNLTNATGGVTYTVNTGTGGTISGNIALAAGTHTFDIANGAAAVDLNVSGVISGASGAITKSTSAGVLQFSGTSANTYTGLTTVILGQLLLNKTAGMNAVSGDLLVTGGTVQHQAANQISDAATVTLQGGTFDLNGNAETIGRFVVSGGSYTSGGATLSLTSSATDALQLQDVALTGNLTFTNGTGGITYAAVGGVGATITGNIDLAAGTHPFDIANGISSGLNIVGVISGTGAGITKTMSAGILQFSGASANTYSGLTTVNTGELRLNKPSGVVAIPGSLTISGGIVNLLASDQISDGSTVTLDSGTFNLSGNAETISRFVVNGGTYTSGGATLGLTSSASDALRLQDVTVTGNFNLTNGTGGITYAAVGGLGSTILGDIALAAGTHPFDIATGSGISLSVTGVISGVGAAITKSNGGTLLFGGLGANTYSGLTTVSAGQLSLDKPNNTEAIGGDLRITGGIAQTLATGQILSTATVTIDGGTFDINNQVQTISSLIFNSGSYASGGATLSLASAASTALTLKDVSTGGNLTFLSTGGVTYTPSGTPTGATLSGLIDLAAGTHVFNIAPGSSVDLNISGVISGAGAALTKSMGSGTLQLSGSSPNTYTGLTTANAGQLALNKSAGIDAIAGDVWINGGTVVLRAAEQIASTSLVTLSSGVFNLDGFNETITTFDFQGGTFSQGNALLTLQSPITALSMRDVIISGPLLIAQGGDVVFDSTNNGTAQIDGPMNLNGFATQFAIANGSSTFDMSISGIISNGSLTKTGDGTLLLTGANTYNGGTLVSGGTLQGNTTSLQGDIVDNANLVFDQTFPGTYSGVMSGVGTFIKEGTSSLTLTNTSTIGTALINSGTFVIDGSIGGGLGPAIVASGATVHGTGTIAKDFLLHGTLGAGHSIGTIHLIGAATFAAGSTLEVELNPITSDLVDIVGTLSIEPGSTIQILPEPALYPSEFLYTVVQTTGGVTGTFSSVVSSSVVFAGSVIYTPLDVLLQLRILPFSQIAISKNALAVAACLDSASSTVMNNFNNFNNLNNLIETLQMLPAQVGMDQTIALARELQASTSATDLNTLIETLQMIATQEGIEEALLQIAPSQYTALAIAKEDDIFYVSNAILNRLDTFSHSCDLQNNQRNHVWATLFGGVTTQNDEQAGLGFSVNSPGLSMGLDGTFADQFCLGAAISYTFSDLTWKHHQGSANFQGFFGGLYGKWFGCKGYLESALLGGYDFYHTKRRIHFSTIDRTAKGSHDGYEGSIHLKGALTFDADHTIFSPYGRFDVMYVHENSFRESGAGSLDLSIRSKNSDLLSTEVGLDISHCFKDQTKSLTPFLQGSMIWENRPLGKTVKALLQGCEITVTGLNPSRTLAGVSAGVNALFPSIGSTFSGVFRGKFGHGFNDMSLYLQYLREF